MSLYERKVHIEHKLVCIEEKQNVLKKRRQNNQHSKWRYIPLNLCFSHETQGYIAC